MKPPTPADTGRMVAVPTPPEHLHGVAAALRDIYEGRTTSVTVTAAIPPGVAVEIVHAAESADLIEITTPAQAARGAREWHLDPYSAGKPAAGPHSAWYAGYDNRAGLVRLVDLDRERSARDPDGMWTQSTSPWPADIEWATYCGWCGTRATETTRLSYDPPVWSHGPFSSRPPGQHVATTFEPCGHSVDRFVFSRAVDTPD